MFGDIRTNVCGRTGNWTLKAAIFTYAFIIGNKAKRGLLLKLTGDVKDETIISV